MIDVRALRENPEPARASQRARGANPGLVDEIIAADAARRAALPGTSGGAGASRTTKVIGSVAGASRAARTARTTESTRTIGAKAGARSARVGAEVSLVVLLAVLLDHQHGGDNADNRNHGYNSSNNVKSGVVVVVRAGARAAGGLRS